MDKFESVMRDVQTWMSIPLFSKVTIGLIVSIVLIFGLLFWLSTKLQMLLEKYILTRTHMSIGARQAAGSIFRYAFLFFGFLLVVQNLGIDLTSFNMLAGAIGIGVGFGLQNIVSNFISGLIILFERPIKVGDRVELNNVQGDVRRIGARSTHILTNNNITIIVPNSKFVTENVINWTYSEELVRFCFPIKLSTLMDLKLIEKILLQVADENQDIVKEPQPVVRVMEYGIGGIIIELRAWSTTLVHKKGALTSSVYMALHEKFLENNISFPNTQYDISLLQTPTRPDQV